MRFRAAGGSVAVAPVGADEAIMSSVHLLTLNRVRSGQQQALATGLCQPPAGETFSATSRDPRIFGSYFSRLTSDAARETKSNAVPRILGFTPKNVKRSAHRKIFPNSGEAGPKTNSYVVFGRQFHAPYGLSVGDDLNLVQRLGSYRRYNPYAPVDVHLGAAASGDLHCFVKVCGSLGLAILIVRVQVAAGRAR
jgi:hypothetical protein